MPQKRLVLKEMFWKLREFHKANRLASEPRLTKIHHAGMKLVLVLSMVSLCLAVHVCPQDYTGIRIIQQQNFYVELKSWKDELQTVVCNKGKIISDSLSSSLAIPKSVCFNSACFKIGLTRLHSQIDQSLVFPVNSTIAGVFEIVQGEGSSDEQLMPYAPLLQDDIQRSWLHIGRNVKSWNIPLYYTGEAVDSKWYEAISANERYTVSKESINKLKSLKPLVWREIWKHLSLYKENLNSLRDYTSSVDASSLKKNQRVQLPKVDLLKQFLKPTVDALAERRFDVGEKIPTNVFLILSRALPTPVFVNLVLFIGDLYNSVKLHPVDEIHSEYQSN